MTAAVALVVLPAERWLCFTYGILVTILASLIVLAAAAAWDHHTRRQHPNNHWDEYLDTLADLHTPHRHTP